MRFKALRGSPKGKAQRGQYLLAVGLGHYKNRESIDLFWTRSLQAVPGVPKIKEKYNPAAWMLEVTSVAAEVQLKMDFAEHYRASSLYQ